MRLRSGNGWSAMQFLPGTYRNVIVVWDPVTPGMQYDGPPLPAVVTLTTEGYGQSWCLVSSGGLVLGLLNGFAVAEVHALDHLGETLRAVQPAPVPLGRLGELEDHGERGLA